MSDVSNDIQTQGGMERLRHGGGGIVFGTLMMIGEDYSNGSFQKAYSPAA
jgi:hypothetical protein